MPSNSIESYEYWIKPFLLRSKKFEGSSKGFCKNSLVMSWDGIGSLDIWIYYGFLYKLVSKF